MKDHLRKSATCHSAPESRIGKVRPAEQKKIFLNFD